VIFTLEAVKAKHGDALLVHYGPPGSPGLVMIDGGPSGVYGTDKAPGPLRQRLMALRDQRAKGKALPIDLMMVSHIDDDHIGGVLELTQELVDLNQENAPLLFDIRNLWHNSFDDILGPEADNLFKVVGGAAKAVSLDQATPTQGLEKHEAAIVASVPQGRKLRNDAKALAIPVNSIKPIKGLVGTADKGITKVDIGKGLTFTVLGPKVPQLKKLRKTWEKEIEKMRKAGKLDETHAAAFNGDTSVYNLSSIMVLAESGGKTMLLTGDGRSDFLLDGLESSGLIDEGGSLHVDILKLPHHGSMRDINQAFFERITADHYVISANGRDDNPDHETLEVLTAARKKVKAKPAIVYLTNRADEQHPGKNAIAQAIDYLEANETQGCYTLKLRDKDQLSVRIDLHGGKK